MKKKVHISFYSYSRVDLKLPPFPDGQSSLSSEMLTDTTMFAILLQTCSPWILYHMKFFVTMCQKKKKKSEIKKRRYYYYIMTKTGKIKWNIMNLELFGYFFTVSFILIYTNAINSTVIVELGYGLHSSEYNSSIILSKLRLTEKN